MTVPDPLPSPVVLLVDDEPMIQELLAAALDDGGFAVVRASNGDQAVAALEANGARDFGG